MKKAVAISFLGNIYFDTRTYNLFHSLKNYNRTVVFYGFDWLSNDFTTIKSDEIYVRNIIKSFPSVLFYLKFNTILFFDLLFSKSQILVAADFYSLPASVLVGKLKGKCVFYDSREIYTELPALNDRPRLRKFFKILERFFINKVDEIFTTGEMDSDYLIKLYGCKKPRLLRNFPLLQTEINPINLYEKYNVPASAKILLYQGIVVKGRGFETCFRALQKNNALWFVVLGGGEDIVHYKNLADEMGVDNRVIFSGKITQKELLNYTAGAFAGISIIDDISINNHYALPNKMFEYIKSGVPVIASNLPQMEKIILDYKVGGLITAGDENNLLALIDQWSDNSVYQKLKDGCNAAAKTLNWENEFEKISFLFD